MFVGEKALFGTLFPGLAMALGAYTLEPAAAAALALTVAISLLEAVAVWFGRFGLTAPLGLAGYAWYVWQRLLGPPWA